MTPIQRVLLIGISVLVLASTFELIRRRKLREEYSLLWLLTGVVLLLFTIFPETLYQLSLLLRLHHLTTMQFVISLFLFVIVLHFSTIISQLSERETELAQQVALLSWQVETLAAQQMGNQPPSQQIEGQATAGDGPPE